MPCAPRWLPVVFALALLAAAQPAHAEAPPAKNVLVIYPYSRLMPANIELDAGLREMLRQPNGPRVEIYEEFLDMARFTRPEYVQAMESYLSAKYVVRPPDLIVAGGGEGLRFVLDRRDRLFPGVPVVHMAVDRGYQSRLGPLPADVVGVFLDFDFAGTIDLALHLQPRAQRLVVVAGHRGGWDLLLGQAVSSAARPYSKRLEVEALIDRPHEEVLRRLGQLDERTIVVSAGYYNDALGRSFVPRDSVVLMASASGAPVYCPYSTTIGHGTVGGSVLSFESIGEETGREAREILLGARPADVDFPASLPSVPEVDWRQLRRWNIDEKLVPAGTVTRFRQASLFEEHPQGVVTIIGLLLVQGALIALLLAERRRRHVAELAKQQLGTELAHASRLAMAGELIGSIAHEINQPLAAILSNADAAEIILGNGVEHRADRAELGPILADIRRDDLRASEVIRRLRTLLGKHTVERAPFDLNDALRDVESLLRPETRRRGVLLEVEPSGSPSLVDGDRVQIQQVILNLVLNAMDAVTECPPDRRVVTASVDGSRRGVTLRVADDGPGVAAENLPKLFESFFTTKGNGMGLGLSIAKTIVEAHGGSIRAENQLSGGAEFVVELPPAKSAAAT
jgi:signal transduction histidine kinase